MVALPAAIVLDWRSEPLGRVEIVPYRDAWPVEFERIAAELERALGPLALRVDHVGSTAVPGLSAKDVIDVQVVVRALERSRLAPALESLRYDEVVENRRDHVPAGRTGGDAEEWDKLFFLRRPLNDACTYTCVATARRTVS